MRELNKRKEQDNEFAIDILALINSEIAREAEEELNASPITKFKMAIKQLINPLYLAAPENKIKFSSLYEKINEAGEQNHSIAKQILAITDISSDSDIEQLQKQLIQAQEQGDPLAAEILATIQEAANHDEIRRIKEPLLLIANPITAQKSERRKSTQYPHQSLMKLVKKGINWHRQF